MSVEEEVAKVESKLADCLAGFRKAYSYVPIIRDIFDVVLGIYLGIREVVKDAPARHAEKERIKYLSEVHKDE